MNNIIKHSFFILLTMLTMLVASCSYDEQINTYNVEVSLNHNIDGVAVKMTNSIGSTFEEATDANGIARLTLHTGIYCVCE